MSYRRVLFRLGLVVLKSTLGGDDRVGPWRAILGRAASPEIALESQIQPRAPAESGAGGGGAGNLNFNEFPNS